jgi:Domain of unknown function (DUF4158)
MPIHIFTEAERATLYTFPAEITHADLITFFTLSEADKAQLPIYSAPYNRLGFALQLCTLRFMGFVPEELRRIPPAIVEYMAEQITVEPVLVKSAALSRRPRSAARLLSLAVNARRWTGRNRAPDIGRGENLSALFMGRSRDWSGLVVSGIRLQAFSLKSLLWEGRKGTAD